jgi:hypothetical protein
MTGELQLRQSAGLALPPVPWRDPHTVSPAKLAEYIGTLERACAENPASADLRTCLGIAHAMNFDVYKSEDALEAALALEPDNFFARLKYAELFYRLRALIRAEGEALKAVDVARNPFELSLARKQLLEIRTLMRSGTQKPEWTKSLTTPVLCLLAMFVVFSLMVMWK